MTKNKTARTILKQLSSLILGALLILPLTTGNANAAPAKDKPLAADLVKDGQLINLSTAYSRKLEGMNWVWPKAPP